MSLATVPTRAALHLGERTVQSLGDAGVGKIGATDSIADILDNVGNATLTYEMCTSQFGTAPVPFKWSTFSSKFTSWLLPSLALTSQLPFGPKNKLNSLESIFLTIGSPTLAAYSLTLTVLNGHWVAHRFSKYPYPNSRNAARILTSLQQAPLQVFKEDALLASLVVLPQNDRWWKELSEWLEYPHTWSISAAASALWVATAYLFTVVDWFHGDIEVSDFGDQAVGSLWVWLLPIVVGWLLVSPKCDEKRLRSAMEHANQLPHVATDSYIISARHLSGRCRAISLDFDGDDELRVDEKNTAPIYNFARFLPWVQSVEAVLQPFEAASRRYQQHEPVDPDQDWMGTQANGKAHPRNRTGNKSQVERYCSMEDLPPLEARDGRLGRRSAYIVSRMILSSLLALLLQWGTTGAAINISYNTPTTGLSCVSGSYLLFGLLSTMAWIMLLVSSLVAHFALARPHTLKGHRAPTRPVIIARWVSIGLRRLGKLAAGLNAVWILLTCLLQFSKFYRRCYCYASVIGRGKSAYLSLWLDESEITLMRRAWVIGAAQAIATAVIFVSFVVLFRNPPLLKKMDAPGQEGEPCTIYCHICAQSDLARIPPSPTLNTATTKRIDPGDDRNPVTEDLPEAAPPVPSAQS